MDTSSWGWARWAAGDDNIYLWDSKMFYRYFYILQDNNGGICMTEQQIRELQGLSSSEARQLQERFGKNELVPEKKKAFRTRSCR